MLSVKKVKIADAIILNENNQILLVKRSQMEDFAGFWSFPGGVVIEGEDTAEALKREILEELNVNFFSLELLKRYVINKKDEVIEAYYYLGNIVGEIEINEEIDSWEWKDVDKNLLKIDLAFNQNQVVKDFLDYWEKKHGHI